MLVLETDTPLLKVYKEPGSFADIFHELFSKAAKSLKPPVEVETSSYYVVDDEADYPASLKAVDAIFLTGSWMLMETTSGSTNSSHSHEAPGLFLQA